LSVSFIFWRNRVLGENHRPVAIHLKNVSYKAADVMSKNWRHWLQAVDVMS
jgi:hypothetical protein